MPVVEAIRAEFVRYKTLAEKAIAQLEPPQLSAPAPGGGNSIATICWHISGNLRSRFTDFLTTDGEKPWRQRDEEFDERSVSREELLEHWEQGWAALLDTLDTLDDRDLEQRVTIRGEAASVTEALVRAIAHTASHVGQIVYVAKAMRGAEWVTLSIPKGQSAQYNAHPTSERPPHR